MSHENPAKGCRRCKREEGDDMFHPTWNREALDRVEHMVSTVLDLDLDGPSKFETAVFPADDPGRTLYRRRYRTRDEALAGHAEVKAALENGTLLVEAS